MQRKVTTVLAVIILSLLLTWAGLFLVPGALLPTSVYALSSSSTPTSANPAQLLDTMIPFALIAVGGGVVGALIGGALGISLARRAALEQRRRQSEQIEHEAQIARLQREQEEHLARLQKDLETQYKAKGQQEETTKAEALRLKMLLALNNERTQVYREALQVDPRISQLQILDMTHPLEVTSIYVRVHLHEEARAPYKLDPTIRAAEIGRDPNAMLQASFKYLKRRVSSAIDPDEAIRKYKRCVIIGDPGAGRTTLLKYLTLKSADGELVDLPDLPIYIELNAFASSGYHNLLDFAAADWDERYAFPRVDARAVMEERLKAGNALLLLDALDETLVGSTSEEAEVSYQAVARAIMQLAARYPQAPIVVTALKAGYQLQAPLTGFTQLEVLDFRLKDMQQFVTNWFNSYTDPRKRANGNDLNAKLERNLRIRALAANPLLLSLIVLVYEGHLELPDRRAILYKRCVDTLLTEWDITRNIRPRREFKSEHIQQLLAELAWHFHQQGRRYFPESEVLQLIADFLPKVHLSPERNTKMLAEITNVGLLREQARGWQGFLHLTLQEYFVAQYATDYRELDTLLDHRNDPWWEEVLLLYAGLTADASPLLRKLIEQDENQNFAETDLILAGRCLTALPTVDEASLWDIVINKLFEALTTTKDSSIRNSIAEVLVAIGVEETNANAKVTERLRALLANKQVSMDVREEITKVLG